MTYHTKHTELRTEIENLKDNIKLRQDVRDDCISDLEKLEEELDKAEIELINLDLEDDRDDVLQRKADGAHEEWIEDKEEKDAFYESKEYQEEAQERLDDVNSFNRD